MAETSVMLVILFAASFLMFRMSLVAEKLYVAMSHGVPTGASVPLTVRSMTAHAKTMAKVNKKKSVPSKMKPEINGDKYLISFRRENLSFPSVSCRMDASLATVRRKKEAETVSVGTHPTNAKSVFRTDKQPGNGTPGGLTDACCEVLLTATVVIRSSPINSQQKRRMRNARTFRDRLYKAWIRRTKITLTMEVNKTEPPKP